MPNYVKNIITFENPEDFQTMVDLTISEKDDKTLFFDFNRVIWDAKASSLVKITTTRVDYCEWKNKRDYRKKLNCRGFV